MCQDKGHQTNSISNAHTLHEIAAYWDTHSLADHWDDLPDAEFEVRALPRRRIVVAPDLYEKLAQRARSEGLSPETLVNLWLAERLLQTS